jgi:hypothetical protein
MMHQLLRRAVDVLVHMRVWVHVHRAACFTAGIVFRLSYQRSCNVSSDAVQL